MREITLVIRANDREVRRTVLAAGVPLTIGRNPQSDIAVTDKRVSWSHARLWLGDDAVWLRDMGSMNGTRVDGQAVSTDQKLAMGSVVDVAGAFEIEVLGAADEAEEAAESWYIDDLLSGLRHPVGATYELGAADAKHPPLTLTRKGDAWWLMGKGLAIPVEPGVPFSANGRHLVLASTAQAREGTSVGDPASQP